jgi:hypothetical protein
MPDIRAFIVHTLDEGNGPQNYGIFTNTRTPKLAVTMFTNLFHAFASNVPPITSCSHEYAWQK